MLFPIGRRRERGMEQAVLITGATGGLGREFARQYAAEGSNIVLVARRRPALEKLAEELQAEYGIEAAVFPCDFTDPSSPDRLHQGLAEREIRISILVNNAGLGYDAPFMESDLPTQETLMGVNVAALTKMMCLFGRDMAKQGKGGILNVASIASYPEGPYMATYYASKAYVRSLSEAVHTELLGSGVHVTALCPGPVRTDFWDRASAGNTVLAHLAVSPKGIVSAGRRALRWNLSSYVPGLPWKFVAFATRLLPRSWVRLAAAQLQKPKRK